ncbi:GATA zinc finger protein 3 [Talaromyces marneffei ATCC 18224]
MLRNVFSFLLVRMQQDTPSILLITIIINIGQQLSSHSFNQIYPPSVIPYGTFLVSINLSKTASTVAPILFRASPIDPALRSPASPDPSSRDLASYSTSLPADGRKTPQLPSASEIAHSFGNPDSTPPSTTLPPLDSRSEILGLPRSNSGTTSLPGLSALASVAIAPTSDLSNHHVVSLSMSYATSSPAATTGGQGNTPLRGRLGARRPPMAARFFAALFSLIAPDRKISRILSVGRCQRTSSISLSSYLSIFYLLSRPPIINYQYTLHLDTTHPPTTSCPSYTLV